MPTHAVAHDFLGVLSLESPSVLLAVGSAWRQPALASVSRQQGVGTLAPVEESSCLAGNPTSLAAPPSHLQLPASWEAWCLAHGWPARDVRQPL